MFESCWQLYDLIHSVNVNKLLFRNNEEKKTNFNTTDAMYYTSYIINRNGNHTKIGNKINKNKKPSQQFQLNIMMILESSRIL